MKKIKLIILIVFAMLSNTIFAGNVEMADVLRSSGKIYVVVSIIITIFFGIIYMLVRLEKKVGKLEKEIKEID